jgi:hypothetical protein
MTRNGRRPTSPSPEPELLTVIRKLTDEVRVLRNAVDELREAVQWGNHNRDDYSPSLAHRSIQDCWLDSMRAGGAENLPDESASEQEQAELTKIHGMSRSQGELFR